MALPLSLFSFPRRHVVFLALCVPLPNLVFEVITFSYPSVFLSPPPPLSFSLLCLSQILLFSPCLDFTVFCSLFSFLSLNVCNLPLFFSFSHSFLHNRRLTLTSLCPCFALLCFLPPSPFPLCLSLSPPPPFFLDPAIN